MQNLKNAIELIYQATWASIQRIQNGTDARRNSEDRIDGKDQAYSECSTIDPSETGSK
jgi:hypothetical protein